MGDSKNKKGKNKIKKKEFTVETINFRYLKL